MNRQANQVTSKYYESAVFNGWTVTFEYETSNGVLIDKKITANATKTSMSAKITTGVNMNQTIFTGGANDYELAAAVDAEFTIIKAQFETAPPTAPTEG